MFNRQGYENTRPGGVGVLEVLSQKGKEQARQFVPLQRTELHGEITGPVAAMQLVHYYRYSQAQSSSALEALYRFPLPGDAAVTRVRVRFGEVEIETELASRSSAEQAYEQALEDGKQAALLTREAPNVFTLRIAGLEPDQEVRVETSYVQLARPQSAAPGWSLRVPLTTAPRYVREDESGSRFADGQPLALLRDPGHRFTLDLTLRAAQEVRSPTHRIDRLSGQNQHDARIRLYDEEVVPDRDFVLLWTPRQSSARPTLDVTLVRDAASDDAYFMATIAPPAAHRPGAGLPREVILLVDHSGSMSGAKWEASDWAVHSFLAQLSPRDQFALGLFHSTTKWFSSQPRAAQGSAISDAVRYLNENRDSGGTNLGVALEQALRLKRLDSMDRARHVLVITDAQVSDAARILALADREAERDMRRRISVLCIDAAPNAFLAHELAERGGGVARFLTSSPDEEDITTALEEVLADWAEPVHVGMTLEVDRGAAEAAGRSVSPTKSATVIDVGDLPCGRALWLVGRVPADGGVFTFRLRAGGEEMGVERVRAGDAGSVGAAIKALFGVRRIRGLEYALHAGLSGEALADQLRRLGVDPASLDGAEGPLYPENARQVSSEALTPLLVRESLSFGLVCSETAFVAVRQEAGRRVEGRLIVPNALPSGWSDAFLSAPKSFGAVPAMGGALRSMSMMPAAAPAAAMPAAVRSAQRSRRERPVERADRGEIEVFAGRPAFGEGEAVLAEGVGDPFPSEARLVRVSVEIVPSVDPSMLDPDLALLIFVGDLAQPRARIRLADLVRLGGSRPLNVRKGRGDVVRVALFDPRGTWRSSPPRITVRLTLA